MNALKKIEDKLENEESKYRDRVIGLIIESVMQVFTNSIEITKRYEVAE